MIAQADANSPDVRVAQARLREARANRDAIAGARLPRLNASGAATTNRVSENGQIPIGNIPGFPRDYDLYDAGFDASWEIDLWGHAARQTEAASARAQAAEAEQRSVLVSLHAEIAQSYVDLRAAQALLASAKADALAQDQLARLTQQRFEAGESSRSDYIRAESRARAAAAQAPVLEADIRAAAYRIALLVGQPPEAMNDPLLGNAPIPTPPADIAMGLRSDMLRRRPDIQAAERRLAAATADVGVATAELFPRFSLIGSIGQQARTPGDLTDNASMRFQFGPSLHWPIFSGGAIRAQIRGADARADAAAANYEKAVLTALNESETAANRLKNTAETLMQSLAARDAQQQALGFAEQRYRSGEENRLSLLQAQSTYAETQKALSQAQAAHVRAAISLYKALGGGWSMQQVDQ
ncbi:efflux transporter outer membrane subunit [Rhizorhapis sp. SPR117]|uniref:efflux transporter outer membrane subunit n=1 Tax=Rhizorhapis sp. SPR117 TaxID=2912611 RepID=UPI001F0181A8|nr:efflux transporter outer membrane subunit [Rhizorhapis sp. SPR117]